MLKLNTLKPAKGSKFQKRRVGRGPGSGRGKTAGRGTKGQKARTGGRNKLKLKGIRMVIQRIPKLRGFRSMYSKDEVVTLRALAGAFPHGGIVTAGELAKRGLISSGQASVKVLGGFEIKSKFTVKGCKVSAGARAAIEKAGGAVA